MTRRFPIPGAGTILAVILGLLCGAERTIAETPGAFPHLEPWPSSLALGGIPEALGTGIEAVLENPTGMLHRPARGVAFSHASLFSGGLVRHQAAALCWTRFEQGFEYELGQVNERRGPVASAYGLGITNLSGDLPEDGSYGELQISLAYARSILLGLQSGLRLRIVQARSTVDGSDGGGIAFDLGVEGMVLGWRAGGVARALFSEIRWDRSLDDPIPRGFDLGLERDLGGGVTALAGATLRDNWKPRRIGAAAEWALPGTPLALRAGPAWRETGEESILEISGGATVRVGAFSADYAFRTGPPGLGEIHRFGLRVMIG